MIHNQKKTKSTEADSKGQKMMELVDKNTKAMTINMLHMLKNIEENMNIMRI